MSSSILRSARAVAFVALAASSAFVVTGCGGGGDPKTAKVTAGPMPDGEEWAGVYFHPVYGYLHLVTEGSNIRGKWKRANGSHWGELSGTAGGNVAHFRWKEHQIGLVGAAATSEGRGYFVYKVNKDNIGELDGQFGLGGSEVGSDWHQIKQNKMKPDLNSVGGDAEGPSVGSDWK